MTIRKLIGCWFRVYASLVWKSLSNIAGLYLPIGAIRKLCESSYFFVIKYMVASVNSMCMSSSLHATEAMLYRLPWLPWPWVRHSVNPWEGHCRSTSTWRCVHTWTISVLWANITALLMIKGIECHQPTKCFSKKMFSYWSWWGDAQCWPLLS